MKRLCLAGFTLALSALAHANGLVAPLIFDKPQYFTNESVQLTVKGQGQCKNIEIDWGDGMKDTVALFDFGAVVGQKNLQATHKYANANSFFPTVKTIKGPTLAEQCGSHSGSIKVVWPGQLSKVSANPNPATVGKTVEIVVEGAGVCPAAAQIRVTPPSGGAAQPLGNAFNGDAPWPRKVSFTPSEAGTWITGHAVAAGQNVGATAGCFSMPAGSDGKFQVNAAPAAQPGGVAVPGGTVTSVDGKPVNPPSEPGKSNIPLPQLIPMKPGSSSTPGGNVPCSTPELNSLSGNVLVGSPVTLSGCGFGAQVGEVLVKGTFNNKTGQTMKMLIDSWSDKSIQAKLPADVTGAPDHVVSVQVVAAGGAKSVDKNANFVAKREKIVLSLGQLDQNSSPNPGVYEWHKATDSQTYQGAACGETVCFDRKLMPTPPFVNAGHDTYRASLKNGWAKSSVKLTVSDSGADFNVMGTTTGPKPTVQDTSGPEEIGAKVTWGVLGPFGWIRYKLRMEIEGPRGVPFK